MSAEEPGGRDEVERLRASLGDDVAAGKTIVLSSEQLANPIARAHLPQVLEDLARDTDRPLLSHIRIPGLTVLAEIGHGGQSTVHLARQEALQRFVAVKIPLHWQNTSPDAARKFMLEARAMAQVPHPNVLRIHDILEVGNTVAIVMEWVDGLTLTQILRRLGGNPSDEDMATVRAALGSPEDAVRTQQGTLRFFVGLVRDIALAAAAVHRKKLLHLDIKPSNVLIRRDGTPLLADFGVVRETGVDLTSTRTFAGTPGYAPPEQILRNDDRIAATADVYSLGMTLYEALGRRHPLLGLGPGEIVPFLLANKIPRLSQLVPVPADLERVVHKALSAEPEDRYASADAFAADLTAFLEHRPVMARPLSGPQRLRRWMRREPWKALLAAVLLLTLPTMAALGTYLWVQRPRILEAEGLERRRRVDQAKQAALQWWLERPDCPAESRSLLEAVIPIDASATALACLLAIELDGGPSDALARLERHAEAVAQHRGLHYLQARLREGRSYLRDEEVETLGGSTSLCDRYLLTFDRLRLAHDLDIEERYAEAADCCRRALMLGASDPAILGLLAWTSIRAGDPTAFPTIRLAIEHRWPDDPLAPAWLALSIEQSDPAQAEAIATGICRSHPRHPRGYELLAGRHVRCGRLDLAKLAYADASAHGARTPLLDLYNLIAREREGDAAARHELTTRQDLPGHFGLGLKLEAKTDPEGARRRLRQKIDAADTSAPTLSRLYHLAGELEWGAECQHAFDVMRERFPDNHCLHLDQARLLVAQRDPLGAADLLRGTALSQREILAGERSAAFAASLLVTGRLWPELVEHARRWHRCGLESERRESAFYLGLGLSRLGRDIEALQYLTLSLTPLPTTDKVWLASALLENAWTLAARNSGGSGADSAALAKLRLAQLRQLPSEQQRGTYGRWRTLVEAVVAEADGDGNEARRLLGRAERLPDRSVGSPDDLDALLQDAVQRHH